MGPTAVDGARGDMDTIVRVLKEVIMEVTPKSA